MGNDLPTGHGGLQNVDIAGVAVFGSATVLFFLATAWMRMKPFTEHNGPVEKMLGLGTIINFLLCYDYAALLAGAGTVACDDGSYKIWSHWAVLTFAGAVAAFQLVQFLWHEWVYASGVVVTTMFAASSAVWASRVCGADDAFWVFWTFGAFAGLTAIFMILYFARRGDNHRTFVSVAFPLAWAVLPLLMMFGHSGPSSFDSIKMSIVGEQIGILVTLAASSILGTLYMARHVQPFPENHHFFTKEPVYPLAVDPATTVLRAIQLYL